MFFSSNEPDNFDVTFGAGTSNFPLPMDSKINFYNYEAADADQLPIFSPLNRTRANKENVPDFLRVLDPKVYNQI